MKERVLLFFLILSALSACVESADCEEERVLLLGVGFFSQKSSVYGPPLDTTFTAVYAVGVNAEMRSRRINNYFYLPAPAKGGQVLYVFQQGEARDTLALNLEYEARFSDTDCPPEVRLGKIDLLKEKTSYAPERIQLYKNTGSYEGTVIIRLP